MTSETRDAIIKQVRLSDLSPLGYGFRLHSNGVEQGVMIYRAGRLHDFPVSSDDGFGLYQYLSGFVRRAKRKL